MTGRFEEDARPSVCVCASRSIASFAPGQQRQVLAVAGQHRLDDGGVDLVGRELGAELLDDVDRPLLRAHAEHVAGGRVLPLAAVGGDDVLAGLVPGLLGVHQDPVQIEI